jgi:chloramphenicol-sensitive protein RarD
VTASSSLSAAQARSGALSAALCYLIWGLVPLYWKQLVGIDPLELIAHRHVWSLALLTGLLVLQGRLGELRAVLRSPRSVGTHLLSATLLTLNWLIYVWGVNTGHVIETSLGYFLVPLVNVAAGRFVLHEHLRRAQWIAIGLAAGGVVWMIVQLGRPPWIALALAATWGGYSLMRKRSPLGAIAGLATETLLLAPLALGFLAWQHFRGTGALGQATLGTQGLILCSGVVTAIPLLLFAYGARRIRLSTLGLLQYLAPSVQLALGIWLYREPFSSARMLSFSLIWAALALYTADNLIASRRAPT